MKIKMRSTIQFLVLIFLVALKSALVWFAHGKFLGGIDDAQIYKTYMENLALYGDWVYNISGERVEGTTSLLWTIIGAALYYFDSLRFSLFVLNILIVSTILFKVCIEINKYSFQSKFFNPYTGLFLGLILVIPGYIEWTVNSLLETGLWSLSLVFLFFLSVKKSSKRRDILFIFFLAILLLTRPESILLGAVFIMMRWFFNYSQGYNYLFPLAFYLAFLSGIIGFRFYYFGYPFPNTYYAKVSASLFDNILDGVFYVLRSFSDNILFVTAIILAFLAIIKNFSNKPSDKVEVITAFFIFIIFGIPLIVGGDHFRYSRMIQPFVPIIFFFHLIMLDKKIQLKWSFSILIIFLFIFIPSRNVLYQLKGKSPIAHEFVIARRESSKAIAINEFFEGLSFYPKIGVIATGGFGLNYKGETNDLLGLNNIEMAHFNRVKDGLKNHASFEAAVFFKQLPDFLIPGLSFEDNIRDGANCNNINPGPIITELQKTKKFKQFYLYGMVSKEGMGLKGFFSKNFIGVLQVNSEYSFQILDYTIEPQENLNSIF